MKKLFSYMDWVDLLFIVASIAVSVWQAIIGDYGWAAMNAVIAIGLVICEAMILRHRIENDGIGGA